MSDLKRKILMTIALLLLILAVGTIGYYIISGGKASLVDCAYMTMITIASVGFGEITTGSENAAGRVFTMAMIIVGVGGYLMIMSNLTAILVEGNLLNIFRRNSMFKAIEKLKDHYILCGCGETGIHVIRECMATRRPVVGIELNPGMVEALQEMADGKNFFLLEGDATNDEILLRAGIERCKGIITCVSEDKDNLVVTIYARQISDKLRVISRCTEGRMMERLRKAGADAVISPNLIGGMRMVSEMVRPSATGFLDIMLRDKDKNLRVEEVSIPYGSRVNGKKMGEIDFWRKVGLFPIAIQDTDGKWTYNPGPDTVMLDGCTLVIIGNPDQRHQLEEIVA
ncbi:MAG: potassium channel family protein [Chitinophagales bacterium]